MGASSRQHCEELSARDYATYDPWELVLGDVDEPETASPTRYAYDYDPDTTSFPLRYLAALTRDEFTKPWEPVTVEAITRPVPESQLRETQSEAEERARLEFERAAREQVARLMREATKPNPRLRPKPPPEIAAIQVRPCLSCRTIFLPDSNGLAFCGEKCLKQFSAIARQRTEKRRAENARKRQFLELNYQIARNGG